MDFFVLSPWIFLLVSTFELSLRHIVWLHANYVDFVLDPNLFTQLRRLGVDVGSAPGVLITQLSSFLQFLAVITQQDHEKCQTR